MGHVIKQSVKNLKPVNKPHKLNNYINKWDLTTLNEAEQKKSFLDFRVLNWHFIWFVEITNFRKQTQRMLWERWVFDQQKSNMF